MKKFAVLIALMLIGIVAEATVVVSDDFSSYAHGSTIGGLNWKPKWDNKDMSQQDLVTGFNHQYAVLSGRTKRAYDVPNQTGFIIAPGGSATIGSDFRYVYAGGGKMTGNLNSRIFGLLLTTTPDWFSGENADFCMANRGEALGNVIPVDPWVEGWMPHAGLGVDMARTTTSKWFRIEWTISDKGGTLEGRAVVSAGDAIGYVAATVDLGIKTGSTLYPGYTTGWNDADTDIETFAKIAEVHIDNLKVQTDSEAVTIVKAKPRERQQVKPVDKPIEKTLGFVF